MECCCCLRNVQDLLAVGKTRYERRFAEPCKGPVTPYGAMVEYDPISARDQLRLHQFDKTVLPGIFLGYALFSGRILKGDILVADTEDLETWTRQKSSKHQCKSSRIATKDIKIVRKRPRFPRTHSKAGTTCKERRSQWRTSRRTRRAQPIETKDDAEARKVFWLIQGDLIYRHHSEPRVQHSLIH